MPIPVFIGDEVTAAGYRLAGILVRTPDFQTVHEELEWAKQHAPLILISAEFARHIPEQKLSEILADESVPVIVVPDCRQKIPVPDLSLLLRKQLGVLE